MLCPESLRVQAYFDGQVDALAAADIEQHMEGCSQCRELRQDLERLRTAIRRDVSYAETPPELRARIMTALDGEDSACIESAPVPRPRGPRVPSFWMGAISGIGGTAIAATLAFFLMAPPLTNPMIEDLVNAHQHSLLPAHLIDVASTDQHTVKPWFAGHADVSPVVADFAPQGYRLIGGRVDYFDRQRAAVIVYQHGAHVINVFSWAKDKRSIPQNATRDGYHLAFWQAGDLEYCAVSDTGWDELLRLVGLLRDLNARSE
ncbi:MAG: anti-sigma factor family protein [Steroidobacteraceae bacterium]